MKTVSFFFTLSFASLFSTSILAQAEMSKDEVALHKIIQKLQTAWAEKDGAGFAAPFSDDHDFIVWNGMYSRNATREHNARGHQFIFNTMYKNWDVDLRVDKVRFIRPDLALVHAFGAGRDKGNELPPYPAVLMSMLVEKKDAGWEIISFHNLDIEYELILRKNFVTDAEKEAYARENYAGWFN